MLDGPSLSRGAGHLAWACALRNGDEFALGACTNLIQPTHERECEAIEWEAWPYLGLVIHKETLPSVSGGGHGSGPSKR